MKTSDNNFQISAVKPGLSKAVTTLADEPRTICNRQVCS